MLALATEDETHPWVKTRVGGFDQDDHPDFRGSADSSWVYADENGDDFSRNAPDHIVQLEPVAELDGAGNLVSRFVYATKGHSPDYMIRDGHTYRIVSDHLGSPRMVIDVDTGAVVQQMRYDEWGVVLEDTNPGWQPFGFAGGLLDLDTGLTRFGARDYLAAEGRWTAKDAVFGGNMFQYASNDPVNLIDVTGMAATSAARAIVTAGSLAAADGPAPVGDVAGLAYLFVWASQGGVLFDPPVTDPGNPALQPSPNGAPAPQSTPDGPSNCFIVCYSSSGIENLPGLLVGSDEACSDAAEAAERLRRGTDSAPPDWKSAPCGDSRVPPRETAPRDPNTNCYYQF